MISKKLCRSSIALSVAVAVLSVYSMVALAAPGQGQAKPSGELSVSGDVTVDGAKAISGATIFSDSTIATAEKSSATISLGKLGRVELLPNSSLKLSFNESGLMGTLDAGRVRVSTGTGAGANISTKDGAVVADASQPATFSVDVECGNTVVATQTGQVVLRSGNTTKQVAAGQDAAAGQAQPGTRCARLKTEGMKPVSGGALAALLLAAGGAIAAAIVAATSDNNNNNFGGPVTPISPTR